VQCYKYSVTLMMYSHTSFTR